MAATYTWAIANLERETADGFAFTAHYTVNAVVTVFGDFPKEPLFFPSLKLTKTIWHDYGYHH